MRALLLGCAVALTAAPALAQSCDAQTRHAIIVHGGTSSGKAYPERLAFIEDMLSERRAELEAGASALDVTERAIIAMEDSGLFNAGRGAISNLGGFVETDASIMDGRDRDAGAVASLTGIKNPIRAARRVMEDTTHVMFVGTRGEDKLVSLGLETVEGDYFSNNAGKVKSEKSGSGWLDHPKKHGTVGAAVLDRCGDLAAGTSTGGYDNKTPGRVGDSPVIGAGTWAQNGVMAGSATGHGEYFIRFNALRTIAARMEFGGEGVEHATHAVLNAMAEAGQDAKPGGRDGQGGIIAVDADGDFAATHSYPGMIFGIARDDTEPMASQRAPGSPVQGPPPE